jgi:hypothetical protein
LVDSNWDCLQHAMTIRVNKGRSETHFSDHTLRTAVGRGLMGNLYCKDTFSLQKIIRISQTVSNMALEIFMRFSNLFALQNLCVADPFMALRK